MLRHPAGFLTAGQQLLACSGDLLGGGCDVADQAPQLLLHNGEMLRQASHFIAVPDPQLLQLQISSSHFFHLAGNLPEGFGNMSGIQCRSRRTHHRKHGQNNQHHVSDFVGAGIKIQHIRPGCNHPTPMGLAAGIGHLPGNLVRAGKGVAVIGIPAPVPGSRMNNILYV
ncbi:hypothetical protein D3C75_868940 [compost metagenome]